MIVSLACSSEIKTIQLIIEVSLGSQIDISTTIKTVEIFDSHINWGRSRMRMQASGRNFTRGSRS